LVMMRRYYIIRKAYDGDEIESHDTAGGADLVRS
jgi:hypothetical protein